MNAPIRSLASCISLAIAGCAGPMGTIHTDDVVAVPVTAFDGSYRDTIRTTESFGSKMVSSWCESPGQPVVTITNGSFTYAVPHPNVPGNATPLFMVTVAQDGSFVGKLVAGTLTGRIDGSRITGQIDGSACMYEFSGERV
jgi:hypothetical protein